MTAFSSPRRSGETQRLAGTCPRGTRIILYTGLHDGPEIGYIVINDSRGQVGYSTKTHAVPAQAYVLIGSKITIDNMSGILIKPNEIAVITDSDGTSVVKYIPRDRTVYV